MNELKVEFFFLNANFDAFNVDIPLDYYLDFNLQQQGLSYTKTKLSTILLDSNVAILNDSYLGSKTTERESFINFF